MNPSTPSPLPASVAIAQMEQFSDTVRQMERTLHGIQDWLHTQSCTDGRYLSLWRRAETVQHDVGYLGDYLRGQISRLARRVY